MQRQTFLAQIKQAFELHPVVALLGPRQCGKTTLARQFIETRGSEPDFEENNYFDLEDPTDLARLETPMLALENLSGLVVIDEIQKRPNLFSILRVLVDKKKAKQHYLILGSASWELIQQSSQTLAGRIEFIELTPFQVQEVPDMASLWSRGGYPLSYLAKTQADSYRWRKNYIQTFLERDLKNLGINIAPLNMQRFWMMLSHYHGNIFNASELARSLDLSQPTIKHYCDILSGTFMIRQLPPWFENISKRQVKSHKIYFRDSGILHNLLGILDQTGLAQHPKLGASWEGFALEQIIQKHGAKNNECYFWATHSEAEIDLCLFKDGKRLGFEFKYSDAPKVQRGLYASLETLSLDRVTIIYPGTKSWAVSEQIEVVGLELYLKSVSKD